MNAFVMDKSSDNGKSIEVLKTETEGWKKELFFTSEEIQFFEVYLTADIFESNQPNIFERLSKLSDGIESIKSDIQELNIALHNHTYEIDGMMECDDISCDAFYYGQHTRLGNQIENLLSEYQVLKSEIINYTMGILKKDNKN
ncbi:hypothetical protein [Salegentibacter chungangensis]|uniref:Uncharacterized protein n=1 Tax=Salegentibacter chungangensis TaxID=1335724 RepID=A0ABW3NUC5_9FLAO